MIMSSFFLLFRRSQEGKTIIEPRYISSDTNNKAIRFYLKPISSIHTTEIKINTRKKKRKTLQKIKHENKICHNSKKKIK